VADVVDQPGALPLLQYALTELFDRQVSSVLTTGGDLACRLAGRNLTPTEWARFGPRDVAHRPTCAAWS
jgi:hypothetical protein